MILKVKLFINFLKKLLLLSFFFLIVRRSLIALLPESQQTDEGLEENLRSPQFQQAIDVLAGALQSDSFHSVMSNLGLDSSVGIPQLVSFLLCDYLLSLLLFIILMNI